MSIRLRAALTLFAATVTLFEPNWAIAADAPLAESGDDYIEACHSFISFRPDPTGYRQRKCIEIIEASSDYEQAVGHECLPPNTTTRKLVRAVVAYMDGHHDLLQQEFGALASKALRASFPCNTGI